MSAPAHRQAATAFVLVTVLLDVMAIGLVTPVLPRLVEQLAGGDTASAASIFGAMSAVWALMQFVFSPVLGALSDRVGRRPVLLVSNFGLGLDYILMGLAPTIGWLFAGRVISGIAAATFSTASAYIADVTPPDKRAASFGLIGAAFGVGFVLGPALGGVLGAEDPRLPFWVAAGLSLANAAYGYFVLPESLKAEHRSPFSLAKANPAGAFRLLWSDAVLLGLAAMQFIVNVAHAVLPSVSVLYLGYRFKWGPREVGFLLAGVGVTAVIVQAGLIRAVIEWVGARRTLLIGLVCGAAGLAIYGLAPTALGFALGVPVAALWGLAMPAAQQIMTARVGPDAQGKLQGAGASLMAIANFVGPLIFTQVFALSIAAGRPAWLAGSAFLLAALLMLAAAALAARTTR